MGITASQVKGKRMAFLALSVITLLFLGLIYAFSMFTAPMCETFGYERADVALTFNIMMIAFCFGCVAGAQLDKHLGVNVALVVAAVMFFAGFAGTAHFGATSIFAVYLLYGVCGGFGVGIGYNSIVATTNVWFPDKVGFSSGVLMMGFGLGSLILGTLSVSLLPAFGLTAVFTGIGVATAVVTVIAAIVLRRPPANIVELMAPEKAAPSGDDPADADSPLKTPTFYVYCVWSIIVIAVGLATIGNCSSDAQLVGIDAGFATLLVGLVSTCNGLARVVVGMVYDKTNVKITMLANGVVAVVAAGCIVLAFATDTPVLYIAGAFCCGFCYGGVPVVASAFSRQRFGAKNYPLNLSIANFCIVFGSLLNIAVQAAVGAANRPSVFMALLVMTAIALADVLPFSKLWNRDMERLNTLRAQG